MPKKHHFLRLEMLILASIKDQDRYGYDITSAIKEATNGLYDLKLGVIYPILYNLEAEHYISKYDIEHGKRIRVYYHIEEKGLAYMHELETEFFNAVASIKKLMSDKK